MIAVDLFCGAGGLTRGLRNVGIQVLLGVDVNEDYRKTYEANNGPAKFLSCDIRDLTGNQVTKLLPKHYSDELALVGCAPCQPFSAHRRNQASRNENRLLLEFERLIRELRPGWVFMENVPGLSKVPGYSAYRRFTRTLGLLGYKFEAQVVDAKKFGVPQTRRRFILLATRLGSISLPPATHGPKAIPYKTVRQAIGQLPSIKAGESYPKIPNHQAAEVTLVNLERLKHTPRNGGDRSAWPRKLILKCHSGSKGHEDVYGRMRWDAPAPTLTCRCFSISNGRYGHPTQHRAISLREAALLQSFPKRFKFFGRSQRSIGEQIGNAVPVLLAEAVGRQLQQSEQSISRNEKKPHTRSRRRTT